jgi:hypothetical protein
VDDSHRPLTPFELKIYRRGGLTDAEAQTWADAGITPYQAETFGDAGLDLAQALEWTSAGIAATTAREFVAGNVPPRRARSWLAAGFTAKEAVEALGRGATLKVAKAERAEERRARRALAAAEQAPAKEEAMEQEAQEERACERAERLREAADEMWEYRDGGSWDSGSLQMQDTHWAPRPGGEVSDIYLRIKIDENDRTVWDVSISEEDAGFSDACLDNGEETTISAAKTACLAAARELIESTMEWASDDTPPPA